MRQLFVRLTLSTAAIFALVACGDSPQGATAFGTSDLGTEPDPSDAGGTQADLFTPGDTNPPPLDVQTDTSGSELPEDFGTPCSTNTDCESELCISGPDGDVCSVACVETCPDGYECKGVTSTGPDLTFACVPLGLGPCQPCEQDTDCAGGLCVQFGDGRACAKPCAQNEDCADGLVCDSPPVGSSITGGVCSPQFNSCACFLTPEECDCTPGAPCQPEQACAKGVTTCDLGQPNCETDGPKDAGDECRPSAGICDVPEQCDGTSLDCPANAFQSTSFICREPAAPCDAPEFCAGDTAACPENANLPAGSACEGGSCSQSGTCVEGCIQDAPCDFGSACELGKIDCSTGEAKCVSAGAAPVGTVCRAAQGLCDVAETCDGATLTCPEDGFAGADVVCRPSTGICDLAESCSGLSVDCPADQFADATTVCRESKGGCDIAETCSGDATGCPADAVQPAETVCRPAVGACDTAEACDGASDQCPVDTFATPETICRASGGLCDPPEKCSGSSADCPTDVLLGTESVCRPKAGLCDSPESCTGVSAQCPADTYLFADTVCREGTGACDPDEFCTGASGSCPPDTQAPIGTACIGGSCNGLGLCIEGCLQGAPCSTGNACEIGVIDCSGGLPQCVGQGPAALGTICRASQGICDTAESCDGTSLACPDDGFQSNDTVCREAAGDCDAAETCPGTGPDCPGDLYLGAETTCRESNGICDPSESCTGTSISCPADTFAPASTVCAGTTSECQLAGSCDGQGQCQGATNLADGTACGNAENSVCTAPDSCLAGTCVANHTAPGVVCGPPVGACQNAGVCSDSGVCLPATNADTGTPCGDAAFTGCTAPDTCSAGSCLDNHLPAGTLCDDGDPGTTADKCDGAGGCFGTELECPAPTTCTPVYEPDGQNCIPNFAPGGTSCNDDNDGTSNDECDGSGNCVGEPITCPNPTVCTPSYTPNGSSCTANHAPIGTSCNDGDQGTKDDQCDGDGFCFGTTIVCPNPTDCIPNYETDGSTCNPVYANVGTACDDSNDATSNDTCDASGTCSGDIIQCPAPSVCTPTWSPNGSICVPTHAAQGTSCNDGNDTTKNDVCDGNGACSGSTIDCPTPAGCVVSYTTDGAGCVPVWAAVGTSCDDGSDSTKNDQCGANGACQGTPYECPASTACITGYTQDGSDCVPVYAGANTVCATASGQCKNPGLCDGAGTCLAETNKQDGTACGDLSNSACDAADTCQAGVCTDNLAPQNTPCGNAPNACQTAPVCDGAGACVAPENKPNGTPCGDQSTSVCDAPDSCQNGQCAANFSAPGTQCGIASGPCKKAQQCNGQGTCQSETNQPNGTPCGNSQSTACTAPDTCQSGVCQPNHAQAGTVCGQATSECMSPPVCSNAGLCQLETQVANGTPCGDQSSSACTAPDTCQSGQCNSNHASAGTVCGDASSQCKQAEVCNSSGACLAETNAPDGTACGDTADTQCTNPDKCVSGVCSAAHAPAGTSCNDGNANTNNDECNGSGGCAGTTIGCPNPTVCTPSWTPNGQTCDPNHAPTGTSCNDGNSATKDDQCNGSGGCSGTPIVCPAPSGCITAYTTDGSGCVPTYAPPGASCNDNNNTTLNDQCNGSGTCSGTPYSCPTGDICTPSYTQNGSGCVANYAPSGTVCGSASNACKKPETCNGGGVCQAETNQPDGTTCGDTTVNACTEADTCVNGVCQANHQPVGTVCGVASGICKNPETCDGAGGCTGETNKANGTTCGSNADTACTNPDSCLNGTCQPNHVPEGTSCGTASGQCKTGERCDGAGNCGEEGLKPDGSACGSASNTACTAPDTCLAGTCQPNHASAGTVCGSPSNDCRNPEQCNGSGTCLGETNKPDGIACGDQSETICDKADTCSSGSCAPNYAPINTSCGNASNACKFGEVCNATGVCQGETNKPNGTACGSTADTACTDPDSCFNGSCASNHASAGTICGTASGSCVNPEQCNGAGSCGSETNKPNGTACGNQDTTLCSGPDSCQNGACDPNHKPGGTSCGTASNFCKNGEICNNTGVCLAETNKPNGTPCGSQAKTACTNPDTCSAGKCAVNHAPNGTYCGVPDQNCSVDTCSSGSCTGSTAAATGTDCEYYIPSTGATICGTCTSTASNGLSCNISVGNGFCHKSTNFFCDNSTTIFTCLPCPAGYNSCTLQIDPFPIPF